MIVDLSTAVCRVRGCGGPASGVCINGLAFDECPNVVPAEEVKYGNIEGGRRPDFVTIGTSSALTIGEADGFMRANGGTLLALVAGPNVGKTTLSSTIYELVRRGRLPGFGFAGSETIHAFEERCFLSRTASMADTPDTVHTPASADVSFLHLGLALDDGRRADLLLSDRSGEHFEEALDQPDSFASFVELVRADAVLLLVDAERLEGNHQAEFARIRKLLLAMSYTGVLLGKIICLVVTKTDKLATNVQRSNVEARAQRLMEEIGRRIPSAQTHLQFTACRATPGHATIGEGVAELMAASMPAVPIRSFKTTLWNPDDGGTALDRLMHGLGID